MTRAVLSAWSNSGLGLGLVAAEGRVLQRKHAKVEVRDEDRFIGVVTSRRFRRLDGVQRQNLIHDVLKTSLTPAERRQVLPWQ